jgi:tripeptidyl-peptidase I
MTQFPFGFLLTLFLSVPGHAQKNVHTTNTHVFKESIPQLSSRMDILKQSRMSSDYNHEVIFVIKQKNMDELTRFLHDVSDPSSDIYGQHMSRAAVANLTSNPQGRETVLEYLHATGATVIAETLSGEYITATAPITVWEEMFKCEFYMFHQTQENDIIRKVVRTESYSIPTVLNNHVDSVFNTVEMPHENVIKVRLEKVKVTPEDEKSVLATTFFTTPPKLRNAYNMGTSKGSASSTQGIYASLDEYYSPNDLSEFQTYFGLDLQTVSTVIGGHESSFMCLILPSTCGEANLDIQYIMAASPVSPTTFWYTDADYFSEWVVLVANTAKPALVWSISYGMEEIYVTDAERNAFETQTIKLGAMGVTIVAASGDDGAISRKVRTGGACTYAPNFPASSPYVTAVGATMVSLRL